MGHRPKRVRAGRNGESGERDRRRRRELRRRVRTRAPHVVERHDVAEQLAPASQRPAVVDGEGRRADGRASCIAHAQLLRTAVLGLERGESCGDLLNVEGFARAVSRPPCTSFGRRSTRAADGSSRVSPRPTPESQSCATSVRRPASGARWRAPRGTGPAHGRHRTGAAAPCRPPA